jgi:transposase
VTLAYQLKLFPSANKADTLAVLAALFSRTHADVTTQLACMEQPRLPSTKGLGEFIGRAYRRAFIDYQRTRKAGHKPGFLKADLIDSAEVQHPRKAKGFDLWIMLRGTTTTRGKRGGFYVPANRHRAINRTLALPGAKLNESAEVFRKNGKFYARVSVSVPLAEVQVPKEWIGCDIGARAAVVRSDGHKGPDLRPLFRRDDERKRNHAYQCLERKRSLSPSRQVIAHEARKVVSVAQRSGRGIALEAPKNLIRWKKHAARFFGYRVLLLAAICGIAVQEINPAYTSATCSRCGLVNRNLRHKETFRCWRCGLTVNSDFNAAVNMCHRAYAVTGVSPGSLSLPPGGVEADE